MILGKLKYIGRYKEISKNIDTAIDYILNNDLKCLFKHFNLPITDVS